MNIGRFLLRHWVLTIIAVLVLIGLFMPKESDNPRSGYYDTGESVTSSECIDLGGQVVGDVCYTP